MVDIARSRSMYVCVSDIKEQSVFNCSRCEHSRTALCRRPPVSGPCSQSDTDLADFGQEPREKKTRHQICIAPALWIHLTRAIDTARQVLGMDSWQVLVTAGRWQVWDTAGRWAGMGYNWQVGRYEIQLAGVGYSWQVGR